MKYFIFHTFLILAAAYVVGAIIGYFARVLFSGLFGKNVGQAAKAGAAMAPLMAAGAAEAAKTSTVAETEDKAVETTGQVEQQAEKSVVDVAPEPQTDAKDVPEATGIVEEAVSEQLVQAPVEEVVETAAVEPENLVQETTGQVEEAVDVVSGHAEAEAPLDALPEETGQVEVATQVQNESLAQETTGQVEEAVDVVGEQVEAEMPLDVQPVETGEVEVATLVQNEDLAQETTGQVEEALDVVGEQVEAEVPLDVQPLETGEVEVATLVQTEDQVQETTGQVEGVAQEPVLDAVDAPLSEAETFVETGDVQSQPEVVESVDTIETGAPAQFEPVSGDSFNYSNLNSEGTETGSVSYNEGDIAKSSLVVGTGEVTESKGSPLKSVSNKGRIIGQDENELPDIEELSESEYARLHKDRPVRKTKAVPSRMAQPDDLKKIKGIGIVLETQLQGLGVKSYRQIADWSDADVSSIDQKLNTQGKIREEKWVEQARDLVED